MKKIEKSTYDQIRAALLRVEQNRPKIIMKGRGLSIASVAEEAGFSRATIYRYYPEICERIKAKSGVSSKKKRNEAISALKQEREKNKLLRQELKTLKEKYTKLVSINASLLIKNEQMSALSTTKNVTRLLKSPDM